MKIAILYSGSIRTLPETIVNNLNFFSFAKIDLYFSIWDHVGYSDRINSDEHYLSNRFINDSELITNELIVKIVPNNINIKNIKIEKYLEDQYKLNLINGIDNNGLSAQYYKIQDCFNLIDKSIQYDALIRLRTDMLLNECFDEQYLLENINNNKIIFPSKIWYNYNWDINKKEINEMCWVTNIHNMEKTCSIYNNTNKINKIILNEKENGINYGEKICYMNLSAEDLVKNIQTFDFKYNILR